MGSKIKSNKDFYKRLAATVFLVIGGIALNIILSRLMSRFSIPLFLDCMGTVLSTMIGGVLPGVIVGFFTNFFNGFSDSVTIYYSLVNVLIAIVTAVLIRSKRFKSVGGIIMSIIILALIGGGIGSVQTWFLYGKNFGEGFSAPLAYFFYNAGLHSKFLAQLFSDILYDLIDKTVVVLLCILIFRLLPKDFTSHFLRTEIFDIISDSRGRDKLRILRSVLGKVIIMLSVFELALGSMILVSSLLLYRNIVIDKYTAIAVSATELEATIVDADRVGEYMALGENAPGYLETKERLINLKNAFRDLKYVYVYHFEEDGIHVVFDLDSYDEDGNIDVEGGKPGDVFPYDESFKDKIPLLLKGEEIEPVATDDTYGWLLTAYKPIKDSGGKVTAYVCADISMKDLRADEEVFIIKVFSLLLASSLTILVITLIFAKSRLVKPLNVMEKVASQFAYDSEDGRRKSVEAINELDINTGDEITNLYYALAKLANESISYIDKVNKDAETITKLQEGIIMDFASMVESRDKCTGDHIYKTSKYVRLISEEMLREGMYPEVLDEDLVESMTRSAPLHDVGKIKISDVILNKPGKLTDEEFEIMKTHTTEGMKILSGTYAATSGSGYLKEAIDMEYCHHERWDGKGYPRGLKGEEIPLPARVMAVADVFDALVSRRGYKEPFEFDRAVDIIREESGTHFDPQVVEAFLNIAESLRPSIEESQEEDRKQQQ
ncbi:MAG: HD domain-containing protein [Clostridiales bacterium]|nr:HD domain-containing protein [Clostridiales bacterium]